MRVCKTGGFSKRVEFERGGSVISRATVTRRLPYIGISCNKVCRTAPYVDTECFPLTELASRLIQSYSCDIRVSISRSVTIQNTHFQVSWRLLVEGRIANIGIR